MKTTLFFIALAALLPVSSAQAYDFDTGTNEGWTYRLTNSSSGEIRSGNAGWSDVNNFPNVGTDPTTDGHGSAQGIVYAADYTSASPGDYLILQLQSPNLESDVAWQNVSTLSAYLLPAFAAAAYTPDLFANMAIVVHDLDEGADRTFVTGDATTIDDHVWTLRNFDVASTLAAADPPVTNYDVKQVIVNFWIAVASDRYVYDLLPFCIDEISPCETVYASEEDFRATAGPTDTYGFECHGLSEDSSDLVLSPVSAANFEGSFDIAYSNLNAFNVAHQPGSPCNADGDRSLFTHSVVAGDYSLTFSNFGGVNSSITAFGLTVCDFASNITEPASITYDTGTHSGTLLVVPGGQPDNTSNFVGIVVCPEDAFDSITLTFDDNSSGFQWFDEVIYSYIAPAVPTTIDYTFLDVDEHLMKSYLSPGLDLCYVDQPFHLLNDSGRQWVGFRLEADATLSPPGPDLNEYICDYNGPGSPTYFSLDSNSHSTEQMITWLFSSSVVDGGYLDFDVDICRARIANVLRIYGDPIVIEVMLAPIGLLQLPTVISHNGPEGALLPHQPFEIVNDSGAAWSEFRMWLRARTIDDTPFPYARFADVDGDQVIYQGPGSAHFRNDDEVAGPELLVLTGISVAPDDTLKFVADIAAFPPSGMASLDILGMAYGTSVTAAPTEAGPSVSRLLQNRPNPANPTTEIRFFLQDDGPYQLRVYTTSGRLVDEVQGLGGRGENTVVWDARKGTLSSGVYFYQLRAGEYVDTKTMVLLK